jgi:hypothetical protein
MLVRKFLLPPISWLILSFLTLEGVERYSNSYQVSLPPLIPLMSSEIHGRVNSWSQPFSLANVLPSKPKFTYPPCPIRGHTQMRRQEGQSVHLLYSVTSCPQLASSLQQNLRHQLPDLDIYQNYLHILQLPVPVPSWTLQIVPILGGHTLEFLGSI